MSHCKVPALIEAQVEVSPRQHTYSFDILSEFLGLLWAA